MEPLAAISLEAGLALAALNRANVPDAQVSLNAILKLCVSTDANYPNLGKVLLSPDEIYHKVQALGQQISRDHPDGVHLVGILHASARFVADLARHITPTCSVEFIEIGTEDIEHRVFSSPVILCDTIRDSGTTLSKIRKRLVQPTQICVLLEKDFNRRNPDYFGTIIDHDLYPVGYGLDHNQAFRSLSYIVEYKNPTHLRSRTGGA